MTTEGRLCSASSSQVVPLASLRVLPWSEEFSALVRTLLLLTILLWITWVMSWRSKCFDRRQGRGSNQRLEHSKVLVSPRTWAGKGLPSSKQQVASSKCFGHSPLRPDEDWRGFRRVSLVNAGALPDKHPQRYYRYALLDPLDVPFATFRYYYRSWGKLTFLLIPFTG